MSLNKNITILTSIVLLSIQNTPVTSANETKPMCTKPFKVSFYELGLYYMPDKKAGIDVDIVNEVKKRSGCQFVTDVEPRARIWEELKNGKLDFATSGIQTPERNEFAFFSNFVRYKIYVLIRKDVKEKKMNDFINNKNLTFGAIRSFKHGSEVLDNMLDKLREQNRVEESTSQELLFKKLDKNRVQATISSVFSFKKYFNEIQGLESKVDIVDWIPEDHGFNTAFLISRKTFNENEIKKWDNIIKEMVKDGTIKKIFKKYLTNKEITKYTISLDEKK